MEYLCDKCTHFVHFIQANGRGKIEWSSSCKDTVYIIFSPPYLMLKTLRGSSLLSVIGSLLAARFFSEYSGLTPSTKLEHLQVPIWTSMEDLHNGDVASSGNNYCNLIYLVTSQGIVIHLTTVFTVPWTLFIHFCFQPSCMKWTSNSFNHSSAQQCSNIPWRIEKATVRRSFQVL